MNSMSRAKPRTGHGEDDVSDSAGAQASLEAVLKDDIIRMYQDVAEKPDAEYHFFPRLAKQVNIVCVVEHKAGGGTGLNDCLFFGGTGDRPRAGL